MHFDKEECLHFEEVLQGTKQALFEKNSIRLREYSNQTIHTACNHQDSESITIAIIIYSLSKLVERKDYKNIRNWDGFVKKFNAILDLAIKSLRDQNEDAFQEHIARARKLVESNSIKLKPYIQDILKKASINKGSKIYEHGISLERTSRLLGITQWELADYIGSKSNADIKQNQSIDVKSRAKMALEFFSK